MATDKDLDEYMREKYPPMSLPLMDLLCNAFTSLFRRKKKEKHYCSSCKWNMSYDSDFCEMKWRHEFSGSLMTKTLRRASANKDGNCEYFKHKDCKNLECVTGYVMKSNIAP